MILYLAQIPSPHKKDKDYLMAFQVLIDYEGSAFFKKGENRKFKVKVINSNTMREQQWVKIKFI